MAASPVPVEPFETPATPIAGADLVAKLAAGGHVRDVSCRDLALSKQRFEKGFVLENGRIRFTEFKRLEFAEPVTFKNCVFEGANWFGLVFHKGASFEGCEFRNLAKVVELTSKGPFSFRNCVFSAKIQIEQTTFEAGFECWDSRFRGWADLIRVQFLKDADFRSAEFHEGLVLKRCTISGDALFRGTTVHKKLSFQESKAERLVDLSKAKLHDFAYVEELECGPETRFGFWNAIVRAMLVRPEQIDGRLASEIEGNDARAAEEYGVLKNNYATLHWLEEEDWAYYRYKRARWRTRAKANAGGIAGGISRLAERVIFDWGCGYGTMPMRVLASAVIVILFFAGLYALPTIWHDGAGYEEAGPGLSVYRLVGSYPVDSLLTSLIASTSAFVSGFDAVDKNVEGPIVLLLTLEGLFGMLLLGLFIVAFSRKVIR